ncbi:FtsJ-domain-containing protein [Nadsonia fulvescens var. elongata DSM 6958]|uniref:FtsJ-domain-containing protein n=1 Tax=Nadsonia fulvescens var. elongata DSM 6958 TaxID=857566 RepID=A0A1E3PRG9_9ASCO|nr:FtsJ-domain-containing protein [Nadsonia fulvescens var. elongata DSM 6958]
MGKSEKKHGKGRLDHYYRLAKEKGYRARSSFKIVQINQKFGHFLEKSKVVIDLCAAPGSWCQVASQLCPVSSLIIGVDLAAIKPLPNVITFVSDITTEHCRAQLRQHMKTWKADTVMHDGAPNVGMAWAQDAFTQSELVLQSLKLAVEFLTQGGTFVTKVFRSKDYNNLMWVFQQFFDKVEATKPPSSRNVSAEIFVVCRGFKAPKKIDPRLLDPKSVFEELADETPNYEDKVFNPEKKKRKRDGYTEGDYTLYHTVTAMEFIKTDDPISILGSKNKIIFDEKVETELKPVKKLPQTTDEILECFLDLKVLGKKDFRHILKWRLAARELLKVTGADDEDDKDEVEVEPIDEEEQIEKELSSLQEKEKAKKKREKRRANERKQKEIERMQMNMTTPMDIGIDAGQQEQSLFNLKVAERSGKLNSLTKGKKAMVFDNDPGELDNEGESDYDTDNADEDLEAELDNMYNAYKERRNERDAEFKAKKLREANDNEWYGITDTNHEGSDYDNEEYINGDDNDVSSDDEDDDESINKLISTLEKKTKEGHLSRKAAVFFNDPIFDGLDDTVIESKPKIEEIVSEAEEEVEEKTHNGFESSDEEDESNKDFEVVPNDGNSWDSEDEDNKGSNIDIVTAEAMTLAHSIALKQKSKHDIIDEGYNRTSFRDRDGLPDWFIEDEDRHSKFSKPITKEAVETIKAKLKAFNDRPIKKVAEAQARKKYKASQRLEKLKKKSDLINEDDGRSEKEKASDIQKLLRKATKKKERPKVTVVAARGFNRGVSGRPKGVKGRYKMVDGTMKKEQRSLKRIKKKMS